MAYPKNRTRAKKKSDRKYFSNTAKRVKKKNYGSTKPMRGGIRL